VDAAGDLAQLVDHPVELVGDPADLHLEIGDVGRLGGLDQAQLEAQRDQSLLDAVMQIALNPAPGLVVVGGDPGPGRGELGAAVGVGDRGADELSEIGHALFGAAGKRSPRVPTLIAPHRRLSTTIGAATPDRIPSRRTASPDTPEAWP